MKIARTTLHFWSAHARARAAVYTLAVLAACIPAIQTYRSYSSWLASPFNAPVQPGPPSGSHTWFRLTEDGLVHDERPGGADSIGFEFVTSMARVEPIDKPLAFCAVRIFISDVVWAEPAGREAPELDTLAPLLCEAVWTDADADYTLTNPVPGVYDLRYVNTPTANRFLLRMARAELPKPLLILAACILASESLALVGRRLHRPGPNDCQSCGYPLCDLPELVCPECGKPPYTRQ